MAPKCPKCTLPTITWEEMDECWHCISCGKIWFLHPGVPLTDPIDKIELEINQIKLNAKYTLKELSRLTSISNSAIHKWIASGKLKAKVTWKGRQKVLKIKGGDALKLIYSYLTRLKESELKKETNAYVE